MQTPLLPEGVVPATEGLRGAVWTALYGDRPVPPLNRGWSWWPGSIGAEAPWWVHGGGDALDQPVVPLHLPVGRIVAHARLRDLGIHPPGVLRVGVQRIDRVEANFLADTLRRHDPEVRAFYAGTSS